METGNYYLISHAYYHYLAEVVEVLGPRRVKLGRCIQVHSCQRGWTDFFAAGCKSDTRFDVLPEGGTLDFISAWPWAHDIPKVKR